MQQAVLHHKKRLIAALGDTTQETILDYGCGYGDFIELLLSSSSAPKSIIATDSSKKMIEKIQDRFADDIAKQIVTPKICTSPSELKEYQFNKIICQNVLECVEHKVDFINDFFALLMPQGLFILSHHDFDSAIYNSEHKELTRKLIHYFSDTQQAWQAHCDGQMGRKIPGLIASSLFKDSAIHKTWRIVEKSFKPGTYGYLMAQGIIEVAKPAFDDEVLSLWLKNLEQKSQQGDYYFAIDLVLAILRAN